MIKPALSLIIVNYNTKKLLKECLESIICFDRRLDFSGQAPKEGSQEEAIPAEIIVVDNASTDGSRGYLKKLKGKSEKLKVIFNQKNLGFGKANNLGMKKAKGEYFLLLNSDTRLFQAAVSQTLFWLSSHPEYDLIGCRLVNPDKSPQPSAGRFPHLLNVFLMLFFDHFLKKQLLMSSPLKVKETDWAMGAFMLLRKEVFAKTKGFDERIFMYMEEVEWCFRIKKAGFRIGFYPGASIIHLGGGSSDNRGIPILNIYQGLVYFYRKHYSKTSLFILKLMLKIKAGLSFFWGLLRRNEDLQKTYARGWKIN